MDKIQKKAKIFWNNLDQKKRIILIAAVALFIFIIIYSVATLIFRSGKIETTVKFAPYKSTITLNDAKISNNTTIWLEPGTYNLKVEFEHFESLERQITIDKDHHYIVGILNSSDEQGVEYYNKHKEEFAETEGIVGRFLNEEGLAIKKKYPILNYLPINNSLYSISYDYTDEMVPIISIKTQPKYLDAAVAKLKTLKNVDLTAYQINFTPANPFAIYNDITADEPLNVIKKAFKDIDSYYILEGQYIGGEYFTTQIYTYDYDSDLSFAHYRALLHKDGDKWKLVSAPQPLLTTENTPNTEKSILDSANSF